MARTPRGYRRAATALDPKAKVQLTGPLFEPDADLTLRQNIRRMIQATAEEGESVVKQRAPRQMGDLADNVVGRTRGRRAWFLTGVISATHVYPWATWPAQPGDGRRGGRGERGFTGRAEAEYRGGKAEERYRMFRAATYQLRAARAVMAANLTKGLE
jgi:hypothetical protein